MLLFVKVFSEAIVLVVMRRFLANFPPGGCFNSWLQSSLWLQFKPHHIAAGAAYLAAKILNFDLATHHGMWQEFQTTSSICQDVVKQLTELF
ncbi:hypothetical protein IFM89_014650 [Coptis chinensis]|uniref:Cyclin C-terminal domain-containing protein n=1 Tax=Coptis chinensis TaxID=261450 RepID=A0A835H5B3_9MAGN|nr:hypothetical protein IFM89_014650 [Coptis chinensis]